MAATKKTSRSGSRSRSNPTTKAQRLTRVAELTERMDARLEEVKSLGAERSQHVRDLRSIDGVSFAEIARHAGKSPQAIHKSLQEA